MMVQQHRSENTARAYLGSDAQDPRLSLVENVQRLPSKGRRRLKKRAHYRFNNTKDVRVASLNVGTMSGRSLEIVKLMKEKRIDILLVQETKWKGERAAEIGAGYKIYYVGVDGRRNGVGIILTPDLKENVLEIVRINDRIIRMKIEWFGENWNIVSVYAPQIGCTQVEKENFWRDLDGVIQELPTAERLLVGGDFNGHVGASNRGFEEVHGGHGLGVQNDEGLCLLDFALSYEMKIINTMFIKAENHLITYKSGQVFSQIDYMLVRKEFAVEVRNCKTLPYEQVTSQHRTLMTDIRVRAKKKWNRRKPIGKVCWWKLKDIEKREAFVNRVREQLTDVELDNIQDIDHTWCVIADIIRTTGIEICGRSSGKRKNDKETWWWSEEIGKILKTKKEKLKIWCQRVHEIF